MARLSSRRLITAPWLQRAIGVMAAQYLRLVWNTSRFAFQPADIYERIAPDLPIIVAVWHGQHLLVPFARLPHHRFKALISRHRDGEVNAVALERLGVETIRGSGDHGREFHRKGAVGAFKAMLNALQDGDNVVLTADVPKVARVAGLGIVKLAAASGRPIYPVAVATSRRIELDNWDRSALNLPFSRGSVAFGEPVRVSADADDAALEAARLRLQAELDDATRRAYAHVDAR